jgi:hypothetical protein
LLFGLWFLVFGLCSGFKTKDPSPKTYSYLVFGFWSSSL